MARGLKWWTQKHLFNTKEKSNGEIEEQKDIRKDIENKQQSDITKVTILSVIAWNVNGLNTPIKKWDIGRMEKQTTNMIQLYIFYKRQAQRNSLKAKK